jgi:hypothetical protein
MMGQVPGRASAVALVAALLGMIPRAVPAQRLAAFEPDPSRAQERQERQETQEPPAAVAPSQGRLVAGSALGASVGALTGWTAGALIVLGVRNRTSNPEAAFADVAIASLIGSGGAVVLGGLGSRIGVRAVGGTGGPLKKHILASLVGWGASVFLLDVLYADNSDPNTSLAVGGLVLTHGLVTALLAPQR